MNRECIFGKKNDKILIKSLNLFHLRRVRLKIPKRLNLEYYQSMSRILIVEDEPRLAQFIEKGLKKQGFVTFIANNGQKALSITQNEQFDLILLDLGLPIIDGWTFLETLRNKGNQIPVLIMTAWDQAETRNKGKAFNVKKYIDKPFHFQDLLEQVNLSLYLN